jgi:hypothetical protein
MKKRGNSIDLPLFFRFYDVKKLFFIKMHVLISKIGVSYN